MPSNQSYQGFLSPLIALAASFRFILVFPLIYLIASLLLVQDSVPIFHFSFIYLLNRFFPLYLRATRPFLSD